MNRKPMVVSMRGVVTCILLTGFLLPISPKSPLPSVEYFVDATGSGTTCTQAVPCPLSVALGMSDPVLDIYLAAGTYTGTGNEVILDTCDKPINLYGGWDGSTIYPPVRDPETYISIIDGQNLRRGIKIWSDSVEPFSPVITGLSIINGNASGLTTNCTGSGGNPSGCGGGIFIYNASPIISYNRIYNNKANTNSVAFSSGYGGGIYSRESDGAQIYNNLIYSNLADEIGQGFGGGVAFIDSTGTTSFYNNQVYNNNAGINQYTWGAGLGLHDDSSHIYSNVFYGNGVLDTDKNAGSAMYLWYGSPDIENNLIEENYGGDAVFLGYANNAIFHRNRILDNHSTRGITLAATDRADVDCSEQEYIRVFNNFINGPIYVYGSPTVPLCAKIWHNTLDGSTNGLYLTSVSTVSFINNIVSNHPDTGIYVAAGATNPLADHTLFYNNGTNGYEGSNILTGDPLYYDRSARNYHIWYASPARDAGDGSYVVGVDIDDQIRPASSEVDIGADEWMALIFLPMIQRP